VSGGIFLLHGDELVAMHEKRYDSEDLLQTLLAKYPSLIAGEEELNGSSRRWLLVKREVGVPDRETGGSRWSLDHLFIDQEAVPTLVEVKRSDDTRIRREVVGQLLDYAANGVVYWPAERLRSDFEGRCAKEGKEPQDVFRASLGDELDPERFWDDVEQNLRSGRVRLIFVSDAIPAELRRVIEFLNERMSPTEVLGIEIKQYIGDGDLKTLVPRIVGQTEQARIQKVGGGQSPTVDVDWDYYEQQLQPERLTIVREMYDRMERAIAERGLSWQPKLKSGYVGFCRPGIYYCCGISIRKEQPVEFWIKLPLPPEELRALGHDVPDLYPDLQRRWDSNNKQWTWKIPTLESIPNLATAVELTTRYQPPGSGPMPVPTS
jgi:hypothetical protein